MPSIFAFYRARGVPGAYVVGIQLDLLPTESAQVSVRSRYFTRYPPEQQPIQQYLQKEGEQRHLYRIEQVVIDDTITIQINDRQLHPFQETSYTAMVDGFTRTDVPYSVWSHEYDSRHNYGVVILNHITMIDLDKTDIAIQQSLRIVEAEPVKPEPKKRQRKRKPQQEASHDNNSEPPAVIEDPAFQF